MTTAIDLLRAQYKQSFDWLQGTMAGVTDDVARYNPPGLAGPIAGQIAHSLTGLDFFILGHAAGGAPLMTSTFAGKAGISEPPPQGDWSDWGEQVQVNLPEIHEYAKAIFEGIDVFLATLTDSDLDREVDLGATGKQTMGWIFNIMILNTYCHTGEIACLKGLQGLKGYPM